MAKSIFMLVIIFFGAGLSIECYSATQKDTINREEIIKSLKEAHLRDQEPRSIIDSLMRNGIVDGNLFLPAIMQQREWDSINQKIVLPIIDTLIRFEIYDLEPVAYNACWLIIQHAGHDIMTKYTGFVEQLVKREIIPVSSYMAFIDRLQVHQRKAQIYGYQFKRLTDGTMIQFPVLTGQKKKWREWGHRLKTTDFLPSDYKIDYPAVKVKKDQFVVIGFVYNGRRDLPIETHSPLTNAKVLVNESVVTITDSSGYFCAIVNKKTLPSTIKVVINGNPIEYEIEQNKDSDFFISTGYFHDGKLDVME